VLLLTIFSSVSLLAQNNAVPTTSVALREGAPTSYTVQAGDTLWGIAGRFLTEPWRWTELWDNNPGIDNPHLIYPGDELTLTWRNGQPRLRVSARGAVKLSPEIRSTPLNTAIPPIPRELIDPFLRNHQIVDPVDFQRAPYVIAAEAGRLVSGAGDKLYVRGRIETSERVYGIVREGELLVDPTTKEVLGLAARDIGTASLLADDADRLTDGAVKTFQITRSTEEARIKDKLIPAQQGIVDAYFQPKAPDVIVEDGYMIAVDGGVSQIGSMNIVTLNVGAREGIVVGDVMAIFRTGETVRDPVTNDWVALPDEQAGMLMVFAAFDKASYALVLKATRPLELMDKVKNP
jgi:hypothetical protein